jgi:hypothetical protein
MQKMFSVLILGLCMVFGFLVVPLYAQDLDSLLKHSRQFAEQQLVNTVKEVGDPTRYPRSTLIDGTWKTTGRSDWTSGFFPGALWYMYKETRDTRWREWAKAWTAGLEDEKNNTGTHDMGFKIFSSFGHGYRLRGRFKIRRHLKSMA